MQNNPLVSVVMSVYNTEKYLAEAIESILNQTYSYFEFIIIDDGSTDSSLKIIKKYASKDQRIHVVINEKNIGLAKSLNKGIDISRGVYLARMDADDMSMPDRFDKQVAFLTNHPEICVLGGQVKFIGSSNSSFHYAIEKELLRWHLLLNIPIIVHPTVMMKREAVILAGNYPENYLHAEDRALWTRMYIQYEYPAANLPDILLHYRVHENNVSVANIGVQLAANQKLVYELLSYEFNTYFDENIVNALINPNALTYRQANKACEFTLGLFNNFVSNHQLKDSVIMTKFKQTTASYMFSRIYRFPIQGFSQIIKSILFYPPLTRQYFFYYLSVPQKTINKYLMKNTKIVKIINQAKRIR